MSRLPAAEHLNDKEYRTLMRTYANHNSSMGLSERVKYSASDIVKVEVNKQENCLNVHYNNGDWWKYTHDGRWY